MVNVKEVWVCTTSDLTVGRPKTVRIDGTPLLILLKGDALHAISAYCPHKSAPLVAGIISEQRDEIICPRHRFRFSLETGACVASPERDSLTVYAVTQRDGDVFVHWPDPS